MATQLARLDHVTVRRTRRQRIPVWPVDPRIRTAVGALARSLLIGLGARVTLSLGHSGGVVGIAAAGVLALGAALTSWDT